MPDPSSECHFFPSLQKKKSVKVVKSWHLAYISQTLTLVCLANSCHYISDSPQNGFEINSIVAVVHCFHSFNFTRLLFSPFRGFHLGPKLKISFLHFRLSFQQPGFCPLQQKQTLYMQIFTNLRYQKITATVQDLSWFNTQNDYLIFSFMNSLLCSSQIFSEQISQFNRPLFHDSLILDEEANSL